MILKKTKMLKVRFLHKIRYSGIFEVTVKYESVLLFDEFIGSISPIKDAGLMMILKNTKML